jgi:hypothetical protein
VVKSAGHHTKRPNLSTLKIKKMKSAVLCLFFSALHIAIFSIVRAYDIVPHDLNFIVFWLCLALTWAGCFKNALQE